MKVVKIKGEIYPKETPCLQGSRALLMLADLLPNRLVCRTSSAESTSVNSGAVSPKPDDRPVQINSHFAVRGGGTTVSLQYGCEVTAILHPNGYIEVYLKKDGKIKGCGGIPINAEPNPKFWGIEPLEVVDYEYDPSMTQRIDDNIRTGVYGG